MTRPNLRSSIVALAVAGPLITVILAVAPPRDFSRSIAAAEPVAGSQKRKAKDDGKQAEQQKFAAIEKRFQNDVRPLLKKHCVRCHNVDERTSGVRVDHLDGKLADRNLKLWKAILRLVESGEMPPEDEPQPTKQERKRLAEWIRGSLNAARSRQTAKNGTIRRLTVAQYRNTLRDLLGLEDNLTEVLPADGVSKDGFLNNGQTLQLSPLLIEAYFDIAEKALDRCIVDEGEKPVIQNFRMDLGESINPKPIKDRLILGANSMLLRNQDFQVSQLEPKKPFPYQPFKMRTRYRFIEGYRGNATVRGWREFDSIYHAVFACMRGTRGYPKGLAHEAVPQGLLLRPAIPSAELFGKSSTYGPKANFKISLRELPDRGRFRVRVKAARYDDGLLLEKNERTQALGRPGQVTVDLSKSATADVSIPAGGIYQLDVYVKPQAAKGKRKRNQQRPFTITLGDRRFSGQLNSPRRNRAEQGNPFLLLRLPAGKMKLDAKFAPPGQLGRVVFTRLETTSPLAKRFEVFEKRAPLLGVHLGLRRDCGSTFARVEQARRVTSTRLQEFVFEGAIANYPSPEVEKDNVNYLAGIREIAVRSEYTDGRDMPRLLIRSVEFEGPFYESWPPAPHRGIFIESVHKPDSPEYAREVIRSFATRAFRRPITAAEEASLLAVWKTSYSAGGDFRAAIKDTLLVVLTSPQFLFIIENSATPDPEPLDGYELASKLSYFLWNTSPDKRLLKLAATGKLHASLDAEVERMVRDRRFEQFTREFAAQWLNLDKFEVVQTDRRQFPRLTRDTKTELRKEPVRFVQYLLRNNLPARTLLKSDFILGNEVVAAYYGLADRTESGLEFVPIRHGKSHMGGVLTQAGILAGLSDGRESNPIKRGAWLARKIIAEPPDDPPPNVPQLPEENEKKLTLRQRLEQHRNQQGCAKCHSGIDPWGIPFEQFDAGGLFKTGSAQEAGSTLPDETEVADFKGLQTYLANDRIDQVAFSVLYHLSTYAVGRRLTYNEIEYLKEKGLKLKPGGYRMREMLRFVVTSPIFLEK